MDQVLAWVGIVVGGLIAVGLYAANKPAVNDQIRCPHCGVTGQVSVSTVMRKKGISGGKATGALMTGGVSMFTTGLSRKEQARHLSCGNCRMEWDVA